ncbi:energy-coupling factor transport system permease protein [Sedimentibacter acidaminivorans]|uniref:Energy-coupling factor transport system permease protein n=1 Tax=Sedimentibacter acidaminivorans TaxID=913099 RepID=A0ABS4GDQ1_9FIRM|nr:energy-coupling factor transport system permease protein [Sedimentibacter acidaminivorans]
MIKDYKIDPRPKLVIVLLLSTLALIYNEISMLFIILLISLSVSLLIKSDVAVVFFKLKKVFILMVFIAIAQSMFIKMGQPILKFHNIVIITDYGIRSALQFILRISIIVVSATIITTSTSREIVQGLVQWKCPYEIAFMVSIAIRFLPILKEEMSDMIIAIQLRGIDIKKVKLIKKIKIYKYIMLPIVTNSILKARELSLAMEMRGFRAYSTRTSYMVLKMNRLDYLIIASSIVVTILFILIKAM